LRLLDPRSVYVTICARLWKKKGQKNFKNTHWSVCLLNLPLNFIHSQSHKSVVKSAFKLYPQSVTQECVSHQVSLTFQCQLED